MTPHTIIFMGPQGSGKGTQVDLLQQKLSTAGEVVVDVQTGRLFRALAAEGSYAGARVAELINVGTLVPDTFTNALWIADMKDRLTAEAHVLIDGFPRTLQQAGVVDEMMDFFARQDMHIINLDTPEAIVVDRMMERGRTDDTPDSIQARLRQYREQTLPVLDHYRAKQSAHVHDIDGAGSMEQVHQAICTALNLG